ncbi:MAG: hypothetical protein QNJ78_10550 [Gammaproteobacteria bacterium]|nr:hypothetical protein [Gammaproteobacteria bacterium]
MSKLRTQDNEDIALIPLWVFFAAGSKWMGGFVGGCLGWYLTQMVTSDSAWLHWMTASMVFIGWSTGTYLDINTYVKERLIK